VPSNPLNTRSRRKSRETLRFALPQNADSTTIRLLVELFTFHIYTVKKLISLRSDLLALLLVAFAVIFVLAPGQTTAAKKDKCEVCHNGKNPHTVEIPCDQVPKYLDNHPGDYEGPCQGITDEKPKKSKP
jgi:hypothetical protein